MRNVWLLALNDLRLTVKDRASVVWLVLLPIALIWFFGQIGGGGGVSKISLTVDDRDGGWLARALVVELADEQVALTDLATLPAQTPHPPKVRTLVIPPGFTDAVLAGRKQTLWLETEPDSSAEYGFAAQVHVLRAIGRILGRLAEVELSVTSPGITNPGADPTALPANRQQQTGSPDRAAAFRALGGREPRVHLAVSSAGHGRPVPSGRAQSVPGMLTMMVMMMTLLYGGLYLTLEKRQGMLRRQAMMPLSHGQILAGKVAGRFLIAAVQALILALAGRFLFGISFGNSPLALVVILGATCFAAAGLSILLGAVVSTPEQAESVGWISGMMLAALGGCWWPAELMPRWLWTAAHALPTAWAMDGFHALISFGRGLDGVWLPAAVLLGFGLAATALGARFLRYE